MTNRHDCEELEPIFLKPEFQGQEKPDPDAVAMERKRRVVEPFFHDVLLDVGPQSGTAGEKHGAVLETSTEMTSETPRRSNETSAIGASASSQLCSENR